MHDIFQIIPRKKAIEFQMMFYFTGKPCVNNHVSERYSKTKICRQCCLEVSEKRRNENPDEVKRNNRKTYYKDPHHSRKRVMDYYYQNHEERKLKHKAWVKRNPSKNKAYGLARRAVTKSGDPSSVIAEWIKAQPKICAYCLIDCSNKFEVDHIYPLSRGGSHTTDNLAIACRSCNASKYNKTLEEWRPQ